MNLYSRGYTFYSQPNKYWIYIYAHLVKKSRPFCTLRSCLGYSGDATYQTRGKGIVLEAGHTDHYFIEFLLQQTDLCYKINDKDDTDPRIVWEAYKAHMRGMIISYTSQKKEPVAERFENQKKI